MAATHNAESDTSDDSAELAGFRHSKDRFMDASHDSPLTHEQREGFRGLSYFEHNPELRFIVDVEQYDSIEPIEMQTSTGDVASFLRWGKVSFEVDGEQAQITVYRDESSGDPFVPFADATSGEETYGAGRYLDVETQADGRLVLDFNYAYNPYCAYNENWSCPITPFENRVGVAIRAGELDFSK